MKVFLILDFIVMILGFLFIIKAIKTGIKRNDKKLIEELGEDYSKKKYAQNSFKYIVSLLVIFIVLIMPLLNIIILLILIFETDSVNKIADVIIDESIKKIKGGKL